MVPHLNAFISGLYSCGMIQLHTIFHVGVSQFIQSLIKISGVKRQPDKSLPKLQPFTVISKNACVVLGCNAGPHTLQGTNTYLIGTDNGFQDDDCGVKTKIDTKASSLKMKPSRCSGKMLIDTGEFSTSDEYIKLLLDVVFPVTNTTHLTHILLTHYHHDHIGGVEPLLAALQERNMLPLPTVYKRHCSGYHYSAKDANEEPAPGPASADSTWQPIAHRQVFRVPSDDGTTKTTVVALFTPGHTADHVSFVLEEDRALLSGDCILGCSSSVFDNLSVYMATLQRLKYIVLKGVSAFDGYDDNNEGERVPNSDVDSGAMSCIPCKDTTTSVTDSCETDEAQIMHIYPGMNNVTVLYSSYVTIVFIFIYACAACGVLLVFTSRSWPYLARFCARDREQLYTSSRAAGTTNHRGHVQT